MLRMHTVFVHAVAGIIGGLGCGHVHRVKACPYAALRTLGAGSPQWDDCSASPLSPARVATH
jgi:hypothetical protein